MAYQDTHSNTFVSSIKNVPHQWFSFFHALYAVGTLVGLLIATSTANMQHWDIMEAWRGSYIVLFAIGVANVAGVADAINDTLWARPKHDGDGDRKKNKVAFQELADLLRMKTAWLLRLSYFFYLGTAITAGGWVVGFLTTIRGGELSQMGYVLADYAGGSFLGRILLAEPFFRFGEQRMLLVYSVIRVVFQLVFWLQPNIIASATALSLMGFFFRPFFATGISVASKLSPKKYHTATLGFISVLAHAGVAVFPSMTGLIATSRAGVSVLQPIVLSLIIAGGICWRSGGFCFIPKIPGRSD